MNGFLKHRWFVAVMALVVLVMGIALVRMQLPAEPGDALVSGGMALVLIVLLARVGLQNRRDHTWSQAREALGTGRAVVFWKPGCAFCGRLRRELKGDQRFLWVNVFADADSDQVIRGVNGGDQLTPTVLIPLSSRAESSGPRDVEPQTGAEVLRKPSAAELRQRLTRHLLD